MTLHYYKTLTLMSEVQMVCEGMTQKCKDDFINETHTLVSDVLMYAYFVGRETTKTFLPKL